MASKQKRQHIFFVYDKKELEVKYAIAELKKLLRAEKFRIFRDSALSKPELVNQCIAKGVENAAAILVVASEGIQSSRTASKILNYADQRRTLIVEIDGITTFQASGWLGVILAAVKHCTHDYNDVLETLTGAGVRMDQIKHEEEVETKDVQADDQDEETLYYGGSAAGTIEAFYIYGSERYDMSFEFFGLKGGHVMGQGDDTVGAFTIAGDYENGEINFTKQYIGKHKVIYSGTFEMEGTLCKISGDWDIDGYGEAFGINLTLPTATRAQTDIALTVEKTGDGSKILLLCASNQRELAGKIAKILQARGKEVVLPDDHINAMIRAIPEARLIIPVINADFQNSETSQKVLLCVDKLQLPIVPVKSQDDYSMGDWLGPITAGMLYTAITETQTETDFERSMEQLLNQMAASNVKDDAQKTDVVFDGGEANGYYEQYDKKHIMIFDFFTMINGMIAGQGNDAIGGFVISGQYTRGDDDNNDLFFEFEKQYTGKHSVNYKGTSYYYPVEVILEGEWSIGSNCTGGFKLTLTKEELNRKGHVMLSYQWDSQPLVVRIADYLKKKAIRVWLDVDGDMKGNINDAMANGVEKAGVVVTFITTKYTQSANCRKEFSYTIQLDKRVVPVLLDDGYKSSEFFSSSVEYRDPLFAMDMSFEQLSEQLVKQLMSMEENLELTEEHFGSTIFPGGPVRGQYSYDDTHCDMELEFFRLVDGRVSGQGADEVGEFTMAGKYNQKNEIRFKKQYIEKHAVDYVGLITSAGPGQFRIDGKWNINARTDNFFLESIDE